MRYHITYARRDGIMKELEISGQNFPGPLFTKQYDESDSVMTSGAPVGNDIDMED